LDLRIVKELRGVFADLRILRGLVSSEQWVMSSPGTGLALDSVR